MSKKAKPPFKTTGRRYKTVDGLVRYTMGKKFYQFYKKEKARLDALERPLAEYFLAKKKQPNKRQRNKRDSIS
jgi:hypothetical protein